MWFGAEIEPEPWNEMRDTIKIYMQPAFLISVVVLAIASGGMSIVEEKFEGLFSKEPWPLKKSLDLLDEKDLASYEVVSKIPIENEEIIKSLGTEDYIQWTLEDTDVETDSAVRKCLLFITYYDVPYYVPHVPEECYAGIGNQRLASGSMRFEIKKNGSVQKIQAKELVFGSTGSNFWQRDSKFSVFYLFNVNGTYAGSREDSRVILNKSFLRKSCYLCKIEWLFLSGSGARTYPSKEEAVRAGQKLLNVILPVLESEHWPVLESNGG